MNLFTIQKPSVYTTIFATAVFLFIILFVPISLAHAQDPLNPPGGLVTCTGEFVNGVSDCNLCTLMELGRKVMNWLVAFSVVVAVLLFVYAGFLFITAGGDEGQVSKGKKIFWSVFIGFVVILAAWLIIDTIMRTFLSQKIGPWNGGFDCAQTALFNEADFGGTGLTGTGNNGGGNSGSGQQSPLNPSAPPVPQQTFDDAYTLALATPNQRDLNVAFGGDIVFVFDTPTFRQTQYFSNTGQSAQTQAHQQLRSACSASGGNVVTSSGSAGNPNTWRLVCVVP